TNYVFGDAGSITFSGGAVTLAETVDAGMGADDTINVGVGNNYIFGGDASNAMNVGNGTNYVFGGDGEINFSNGAVTSASTSASSIGANDTITVGNGTNYVFGGSETNKITAGDGTNYVFGDAGSITFSGRVVTLAEATDAGLGSNDTITVGNGTNYIFSGFENNTSTAGNGNNVLLGDDGAVVFNADGSLNTITCLDNGTGGSNTLIAGTGTDILIGGAGSNNLSSAGGFDIMIGNAGEVQYLSGDRSIIESLDIKLGGSNTLRAGTGNAIMLGGLGPNTFYGNFGSDAMFGQFAYLELLGDEIVTASCWWFGDDAIAGQLSGLSDANLGLNGQTQGTESITDPYLHRTVHATAGEIQRFDSAVAVVSKHGSDELSRLQAEQSSHPGSYDVKSQVPEKNAKPREGQPIQHTSERLDGKPAKTYKADKKNATPAHSVSSRESAKTASVNSNAPRQDGPAPQGPKQGARYSDLSVALAGMVGWGAMAVSEAKEASGLLRKDGFKRLRSKCDNDRFLSYLDQERGEMEDELAWFQGRSNESSTDTTQQI
ncbi:MAG: calcium-binding protein, partial [Terracidiphilus sp.]